jgi:hypothetical protein
MNEGIRQQHYNVPQLLFMLLWSKVNVIIWGRGTGKTEGPIAYFSHENMVKMPGSNGAFVNVTYDKLLTVLLPPVITGWNRFGYEQNKHFFIRRFPPEKFRWEMPYRCPLQPTHYITFHVGQRRTSGIYLVSQDRPGLANGLSIDWLAVDEAKLINYERLKSEVLLTIRGNADKFGDLYHHGSVLYCTDMPTEASGKWVLGYEEHMSRENMELILCVQLHLASLREKLEACTSERKRKAVIKEIEKWERDVNALKKGEVYVSMASTLDNVETVGLDYIKELRRTLTVLEYQTAVLNQRVAQIADNFYDALDEEHHGYQAQDYRYMDSLDLDYAAGAPERDGRWDTDDRTTEPLLLAADAGASFNCCVVGQHQGEALRFLNCFYAAHPEKIRDVVARFARYYRTRENKTLIFYYDHTFIGEQGMDDNTYLAEWCSNLEKAGWEVRTHYIGQAWPHKEKWLLWDAVLREREPDYPKVRFNRGNAAQLLTAMNLTGYRSTRRGFEKDKRPEQDPNYDQAEAPHLTDAADTLLIAEIEATTQPDPLGMRMG